MNNNDTAATVTAPASAADRMALAFAVVRSISKRTGYDRASAYDVSDLEHVAALVSHYESWLTASAAQALTTFFSNQ